MIATEDLLKTEAPSVLDMIQSTIKEKKRRYKLFTHVDLDGVSCAIVLRVLLAIQKSIDQSDYIVSVEYINYDNVNQRVQEFIQKQIAANPEDRYDHILITDISVDLQVAKILDEYTKENSTVTLKLLDHHKTAIELNIYDWSRVTVVHTDATLACGTSLLLEYHNELVLEPIMSTDGSEYAYQKKQLSMLSKYVELVRLYDTWDWTRVDDKTPKDLNELMFIHGAEMFQANMIEAILSDGILITEFDKAILQLRDREATNFVKDKIKKMIVSYILVDDKRHKVAYVFADRFFTELVETIYRDRSDIEIIMIFKVEGFKNSISVKTNRDYIDVSAIAKIYGGGGHAASAGIQFKEASVLSFLGNVFENMSREQELAVLEKSN